MLVTSAATLLFGVPGATLAAPVTAVMLRAAKVLRETGVAAATERADG
jgi:predicted PurR-regulated permease PerM